MVLQKLGANGDNNDKQEESVRAVQPEVSRDASRGASPASKVSLSPRSSSKQEQRSPASDFRDDDNPESSNGSHTPPLQPKDTRQDSSPRPDNGGDKTKQTKEPSKRPEWDMFADQDVDSNFDVSVNIFKNCLILIVFLLGW